MPRKYDDDTQETPEPTDTLAGAGAPDPTPDPQPDADAPPPDETIPDSMPGGTAPEPEPEPEPVAQTPLPPADDWDKDYDDALKVIEEDEALTPGQKAQSKLQIRSDRDRRQREVQRDMQDAEDRARDRGAREHGVTRAVFDKAFSEAWADAKKKLGRESRDAAIMLLPQKIAALRKGGANNPSTTPKPAPNPARDNGGKFTASGSQISPPAVGQRAPRRAMTADEKFDKEIARITGG